jgi:N-acetylglucosaminyldiphosphoundecaprenol N-acetyl-beta-D-mannosaminyltransferase
LNTNIIRLSKLYNLRTRVLIERGDIYLGNYIRRLDKDQIPVCNILGVDVAAVSIQWLLEYIEENLCDLKGDYMCVANVHTCVLSQENPEYCKIQNGGIMAIPDGGPLSTVGRWRGYKKMSRITGPDFMGEIFRISAQKGYRHFFYGSTESTLSKLSENLEKNYPGICITGMYSPPFASLTYEENNIIERMINEMVPDFIWVGLGAPKQEIWMREHQGKLKGFMVGVGAGFDYYAGNISRAPGWMQRSNLEWLYRLIQEPGRLFKRYWHTNTKFIWETVVKRK